MIVVVVGGGGGGNSSKSFVQAVESMGDDGFHSTHSRHSEEDTKRRER